MLERTHAQNTQTLLSSRIPRDTEHEQRIYERQALLCRYRYLLARARELGLHTVLTKYQPAGQL